MIEKQARYIEEDILNMPRGMLCIEAPQGTGKTTILNQLKGKKVLSVGARNQLGKATVENTKGVFETTHLKNKDGFTHTKGELQLFGSFFINLASLHKLSLSEDISTHDFEYLIVDEALLVWIFSTKPEYISNEAQEEFLYRLIHTPKVILLGAEFPDFLIEELESICNLRKDRRFEHIKYTYPIGLKKEVTWCNDRIEFESLIARQMANRQKGIELKKEDSFFTITSSYAPKDHTLDGYTYITKEEYDLEIKNRQEKAKGVLIVSDRSHSVHTEAQKFREVYPWANIVCINGDNQNEYEHLLPIFSDPEQTADIDILILSPVFGVGINIRNEFDLVMGDFHKNPQPHTGEQYLQALLRDRDAMCFGILPRAIKKTNYEHSFVGDLNDTNNLLLHYKSLGISDKGFFVRNPYTGDYAPKDINIVRRIIRLQDWATFNTQIRWRWLENKLTEYGFYQNKGYSGLVTKNLTPKGKINIREVSSYKEAVSTRLGREPKTEMDWAEDDEGDRKDNINRRRELDNEAWTSARKDTSLEQNKYEIHELIHGVLKGLLKMENNKYLMTLEMFVETDVWKKIAEDRPRYNKIIEAYGWYDCKIKNETTKDPLLFLEQTLRKFHFFTQVVAGVEKSRKSLQTKVRKENLTEFNKWKKLQTKSYLRVKDYLFDSLAKGEIKYDSLSLSTKQYIKSFDHILIEEYEVYNHV